MAGRYSGPPSDAELDYLRSLMADFGVPEAPPADDAARLIYMRYLRFSELMTQQVIDWSKPKAIIALISALHYGLYAGMLRNAGQYRQGSDPNKGWVGFGGQDRRERRAKTRYSGVHPDQIEDAMQQAIRSLTEDARPREASARFYLDLSWGHPFVRRQRTYRAAHRGQLSASSRTLHRLVQHRPESWRVHAEAKCLPRSAYNSPQRARQRLQMADELLA